MKEYLPVIIHGMLRIDRDHIWGTASALLPGGLADEHTTNSSLAGPVEAIPAGETVVVLFASGIGPDGKPFVAMNTLAGKNGAPDLSKDENVNKELMKLVKMFR